MRILLLGLGTLLLTVSAQIRTKGGVLVAQEGQPLSLRCEVVNINNAGIVWKKNEDVIAVDEEMLDNLGGYDVAIEDSTSVLTIRKVEPINSANYTCALTDPEVEVVFVVKVQVKPLVVISPDNGVYNARVGETNLVVTCHVKEGNPKPTVTWLKQDSKFPEDIKLEHDGSRIVIPVVAKHHTGKYNCLAKNVAGTDRSTIDIQVADATDGSAEEKPWIHTAETFVPVRKNQDVSIWCTYDGTPVPHVEWLFNGYKINYNDPRFKNLTETAQRLNGYSKTTLNIEDIAEEGFGDYVCRASNKLGSVTKVVHVSGRPGPPELSFDNDELSWTVRSYDKVLEYQLLYRTEFQDHFLPEDTLSIRVGKDDNSGDDKWKRHVQADAYLQRGTKYFIQIKARNALGWGSLAKDALLIDIPGTVEEPAKAASTCSIIFITCMTIFLSFLV